MARQGANLKGVASFHGNLTAIKPVRKNEVKAKILVLNGEDDNMITSEQIAAFKQEMEAANADFLFINYLDAKHSFTNPRADYLAEKFNMPIGYNEAADQASWEELKRFLGEIFRSR